MVYWIFPFVCPKNVLNYISRAMSPSYLQHRTPKPMVAPSVNSITIHLIIQEMNGLMGRSSYTLTSLIFPIFSHHNLHPVDTTI